MDAKNLAEDLYKLYTEMEEGDWAKLAQDNPGARIVKVSDTMAAVVVGREGWDDECVKATVEMHLAQDKAERDRREARIARNNRMVEVKHLAYNRETKTSTLEMVTLRQFDLDYVDVLLSDDEGYPRWGCSVPGEVRKDWKGKDIWSLRPSVHLSGDVEDGTFAFGLYTNDYYPEEKQTRIDESKTVEFRLSFEQAREMIEFFKFYMDKTKEPAQS